MPQDTDNISRDVYSGTRYDYWAAGANTFNYTAQQVLVIAGGDVQLTYPNGINGDVITAAPAGLAINVQCIATTASTTATTVSISNREEAPSA